MNVFHVCLLLALGGCFFEQKKEVVGLQQLKKRAHVESNEKVFHRRFEGAGLGAICGLSFEKNIGYDDKMVLEDAVQVALNENETKEWRAQTAHGFVEVGYKHLKNGFACHEFTQIISVDGVVYKVTNNACKICLNDDESGYWVLEDTLEHYMN